MKLQMLKPRVKNPPINLRRRRKLQSVATTPKSAMETDLGRGSLNHNSQMGSLINKSETKRTHLIFNNERDSRTKKKNPQKGFEPRLMSETSGD